MNKQVGSSARIRSRFLEEVQELWPLAKGALTEVKKTCIQPGCKACASGKKHAVWIYTFWEKGRQRCLYVPRQFVGPLRQAINNGRQLEARLTHLGRAMIYAYRIERDYKRQGKR